MSTETLLERLEAGGMENLWVIYHDYGGRSCAKTVPKEKFAAVAERGVVFARANLSMCFDDHQPAGATFLADTGDFLAVPDPETCARVPWQPATARVHAWMRADDLSPWEGCPRTRLERILGAYAERDLRVRAGFEPELILFRPRRGRRVRAGGPRRHVHSAGARPALRAVARGHRRPARDGHRGGPARQGVRSRPVRGDHPLRGGDARGRQPPDLQGSGTREGARGGLHRELHAQALRAPARLRTARALEPLGRGGRERGELRRRRRRSALGDRPADGGGPARPRAGA